MDYKLAKDTSGVIAVMSGRFTFRDYNNFLEITSEMEKKEGGRYIFDLANVEFMDSAAIGMLLMTHEIAARNRISVVLRAATGQPGHLLATGRMHEMFTIET